MDVYVDSCVFVSSLHKGESFHKDSIAFFKHLFENHHEFEVFTSYFTFLEVACALRRRNTPKKASQLLQKWFREQAPRIRPIYPTKDKEKPLFDLINNMLETATFVGQKTMDTIHCHTALNYGFKFFITTNEKDFQKLKEKGIEVVSPKFFIEQLEQLKQKNNAQRKKGNIFLNLDTGDLELKVGNNITLSF